MVSKVVRNRKKSGGRKKGTPNRTTSEMRELIKQVVNVGLDSFDNDIQKLKPYQRLELISKLLPYIIPKPLPVNEVPDNKIEVVYVQGKSIM